MVERVHVYQDWNIPQSRTATVAVTPAVEQEPSIGVSIQRQRIARMWTVQWLSQCTGIPSKDITCYERGLLIPGPSVVALLKRVFASDLR